MPKSEVDALMQEYRAFGESAPRYSGVGAHREHRGAPAARIASMRRAGPALAGQRRAEGPAPGTYCPRPPWAGRGSDDGGTMLFMRIVVTRLPYSSLLWTTFRLSRPSRVLR